MLAKHLRWREATVSHMCRRALHLLLAVLLLFNGPSGTVAWAGTTHLAASAQHSHCEGMAASEKAVEQAPPAQRGESHHGHSSGSCCNAGSCHCGSMSLSAQSITPMDRLSMVLFSAGSSHLDAPLSLTPARHFRPPIA